MPYKYIGKTTHFRGKTLWEILGNLKGFGVGRIIVRSRFERYPEPSYFKILKVETLPEPQNSSMDNLRKIRVYVDRTFRGQKDHIRTVIEGASYKADYRLIPKDEEAEYCKSKYLSGIEHSVRILPEATEFPPLLNELIIRESKATGDHNPQPKLKLIYNQSGLINQYRVAKDGESPTVDVPSGLGTPISPSLYENLKL